MTQPNWGLLDPNAFARGYQTSNNMVGGIVDNFRQGQETNALRAYAMNPDDPNAVNALAQNGDPRLAIQVRQQQAAAKAAKEERDTAIIAALARDAKDPATFDAAVDQVVAMGYPDAVQFKGKFSPALRSALMAAGGLKDDDPKQGRIITPQPGAGAYELQPDGTMRELIRPNPGDQPFGAPAVEGPAANVPKVSDQATYDSVPPGEQYMAPDGTIRRKPGGPTPAASGGFPGD